MNEQDFLEFAQEACRAYGLDYDVEVVDSFPVEKAFRSRNGWVTKTFNVNDRIADCWPAKSRIRVSRQHVQNSSQAQIWNTVIHEIAHAIVHKRFGYGPKRSHGPEWKAVMVELGQPPSAYGSLVEKTHYSKCENCRHEISRKRIPWKRATKLVCPECGAQNMFRIWTTQRKVVQEVK